MLKVVVTDYAFASLEPEIEALKGIATVEGFREFPGPDQILPHIIDADGIISNQGRLRPDVIEQLEKCRVIVRYGVGVDNLDLPAATRKGILVVNVPDYCTDEVADHTLTLALALIRKLPRCIEYLRGGGWNHNPLRPVHRLSAVTFGLFGFGRIARAVAARASGFGFPLIAYDPYAPDEAFRAAGVRRVTEDELLAQSDLLTLHMPVTDETRHLMNAERLAKLKPGALLVNTARGHLIDTHALLEALSSGQVGGAALDVFEKEPITPDHPIFACENVILTAHFAWYSEEALEQLQRSVGEECARVLRGEEPRNLVNPEVRSRA